MSLSFQYFVFLIVLSLLLTVVACVPVTQTTTLFTQPRETEMKETKTPVDVDTFRLEKAETQLVSRHVHGNNSKSSGEGPGEEEEEDEELRSCRVSNVTYRHREQIPRSDPCEKCVCVDSEMYCLWKLCTFFNSTTNAPEPSSTTSQETTKQSINDNKTILDKLNKTDVKINEIEKTNEKFSKMLMDQRRYNVLKKLEMTTPNNAVSSQPTTTHKAVTSTNEPIVCYVMGVMYKYGEVLPRDTGTCLECSCSDGGRVTCSPKDCVSQPDLDYLSHNNNLDMFELDTF